MSSDDELPYAPARRDELKHIRERVGDLEETTARIDVRTDHQTELLEEIKAGFQNTPDEEDLTEIEETVEELEREQRDLLNSGIGRDARVTLVKWIIATLASATSATAIISFII